MEKVEQLKMISNDVRKDIIEMVYNANSGHPGGSLSEVEMLVGLFFNVMDHDPKNPNKKERDRFVLSKGHACPGYYSVLARTGYLDVDELMTFRMQSSRLQGHPDKSRLPFIETSSGSLGQGLSISSGIAFSLRLDNLNNKVYCMLGDGELDEGQVWEALATIKKYSLNNLIIIIDNNKIQLDGTNHEIKDLEPLHNKFLAFGYEVLECEGNDIDDVLKILKDAKTASDSGKNVVIISHTTKGKGISFMENTSEWHGKAPNKEEYEKAMKELDNG